MTPEEQKAYDELIKDPARAAREVLELRRELDEHTEHLRKVLAEAVERQQGLALCSWCAKPTANDPEAKRAHQMECDKSPIVRRVNALLDRINLDSGAMRAMANREQSLKAAADLRGKRLQEVIEAIDLFAEVFMRGDAFATDLDQLTGLARQIERHLAEGLL